MNMDVRAAMDHAANELDTLSENEGYGKSEAATDLRRAIVAFDELIEATADLLAMPSGQYSESGDYEAVALRVTNALRHARGEA